MTEPVYTMAIARALRGSFVYALVDEGGIFYVGKTTNARRRFYQHGAVTSNLQLARRIRKAANGLLVMVLHRDPPDLAAAEAEAIIKYGPSLLNVAGNPCRLPTGMHVPLHGELACPLCDGPMTMRRQKYCTTCTNCLLGKTGPSKHDLRITAQSAAPFGKLRNRSDAIRHPSQ